MQPVNPVNIPPHEINQLNELNMALSDSNPMIRPQSMNAPMLNPLPSSGIVSIPTNNMPINQIIPNQMEQIP